jgi:hypothetical protein
VLTLSFFYFLADHLAKSPGPQVMPLEVKDSKSNLFTGYFSQAQGLASPI